LVFVGAGVDTTAFAAEREHEHLWYIAEYVEPTCTERGYTEHRCNFCGEIHRDNYTDALGHNFLEVTVEPTCAAGGYVAHFCTVCGFEYADSYTEPLGHDFHGEVIEPTCTTDGYTLYICETDGYSYRDNYVYAYGHDYIPDVLGATCLDGGYTVFTCDHCGDSYIGGYTEANGHDYHEYVTAPTCVAYGYTEHICADCGDGYVTDYIKPRGHDYERTIIKPTENTVGYTVNLCGDCNYSYLSDFVTSGDIDFEEHNHGYSLFVARYDAEEYFIVQSYCACGEIDNALISVIFIDADGGYGFLTPDYNGEVRYSHLYGDYNVYILNSGGEILTNFKVRAGAIPEAHVHGYSLTVTRYDGEKYFTVSYACDCGETDNSPISIIFIDEGGNYIAMTADGYGKVDYSALPDGSYNVFILGGRGEILSTFGLIVAAETPPEEHVHDYPLSVTRHDGEKYFVVRYVCGCGEIENAVFRIAFIDDNGNGATLTADENGIVNYSQLCGNYNVFVFGGRGEMLASFKLTVAEEHIHGYKPTVTRYDNEKYFTVQYVCDCGEIENAVFHAIFIDGNGDSRTLNADGNGAVDYSTLSSGDYGVFILDNYGVILTGFTLSIAEAHVHEYSYSLTRRDGESRFAVNYVCGCGEAESVVLRAVFIDGDGSCVTLYPDGSGAVDYSGLSGAYAVLIQNGRGEILFSFTVIAGAGELPIEPPGEEAEIPNEPPVEDGADIPEKSSLPIVLAVILAVLAAGGIAAFIFSKKRNKKSN
jgi:hypothetical protein